MKKLNLFIFYILFGSICFANTIPGIPVEVNTQFNIIDEKAALWMRIKNSDTEQMQPFFMPLTKKYETQIFGTHAVRYQIIDIWMQFNNGVIRRPCFFTHDMLEKKATYVKLEGTLGSHSRDLVCHIAYRNAEPIPDFKPIMAAKKKKAPLKAKGPKVTAEQYYTALRGCKKGAYQFELTDPLTEKKNPVVSIITGYEDGLCVVNEKQLVSFQGEQSTMDSYCKFSSPTLSLFTPKVIQQLKLGFMSTDFASQTPIQRARCKECTFTIDGVTANCGEQFALPGGDHGHEHSRL